MINLYIKLVLMQMGPSDKLAPNHKERYSLERTGHLEITH